MIQLSVQVPAAVQDADHVHRLRVAAGNIEHKIVVYRHDAKPSAEPGFPFIGSVPVRHPFKAADLFLQPSKLTDCVLK